MKNTSKPPVKEGKSGEMLDPMGVAAVPEKQEVLTGVTTMVTTR